MPGRWAGDEHRNISALQVGLLCGNQAGGVRQLLDADPELIEEPVSVEGAPQEVGMKAFVKQLRVSLGRTRDDAYFVVREARDGPCVSQEFLPRPGYEEIHIAESLHDDLRIIFRIHGDVPEAGAVLACIGLHSFAGYMHLVGSRFFGSDDLERSHLSSGAADAAYVDAFAIFIDPNLLRQQADSQYRFFHRPAGRPQGRAALQLAEAGMKQSLEIDQDRMLPSGDQVLVMKIRCVQHIQQRERGAQPLIESLNFLGRHAWFRADELGPSVLSSIEYFRAVQRGMAAALVQPMLKFPEVLVHSKRVRLINEPES